MENLRGQEISDVINALRNVIRAEYNTSKSFLDNYAEKKYLDKVNNIQNQVIYGRRGTGKTHLLRALQEDLACNFDKKKMLPVYIDLRKYKPLLQDDNSLYCALIIFKEIVLEIFQSIIDNLAIILKMNEYDEPHKKSLLIVKQQISEYVDELNFSFDGVTLNKLGDVEFDSNDIKRLEVSLGISAQPNLNTTFARQQDITTHNQRIKYISFARMANIINTLIIDLNIERIMCLLDEWSEIPKDNQFLLAELLKTAFIASRLTCKLAAIPNRTKLINENGQGLEDGGDIFGINLDNRYIYEINPIGTKSFFNELLYNHLSQINESIFTNYIDKDGMLSAKFIDEFLNANAQKELLIASAGIPRDFINIFINSYMKYLDSGTTYRTISVRDVRKGTTEWYEVDKKKAVESQKQAKIMLDSIINDIIISKKSCHFLVPQFFTSNIWFQSLIDLRVIHIRKEGISHKGKKDVAYNAYYIDYACYTSSNIYHNKIDNSLLDDIEVFDNFDRIRRVSLEKTFFDSFNSKIGNSYICPKCGELIDTSHPAYVNLKACNVCFQLIMV